LQQALAAARLGPKKSCKIKLAVMDMWKPFRNVTKDKAPQAAILFDKFHIMRHLGEALDKVRKAEYARLSGKDRRFIKGQRYNLLLSRHENLTLEVSAHSRFCSQPTGVSTLPMSSRKPSASSGTMGARVGRGASSTTGEPASNGSPSDPTSASPT
jgi:hypothetical protein